MFNSINKNIKIGSIIRIQSKFQTEQYPYKNFSHSHI